MPRTIKKYSLLIIGLVCAWFQLSAQNDPVINFVNPFIGTTKTKINSKWGGEGGTYPGAVAPFGFVQLTPETSIKESKGYDYRDSTIFWFSCVNHMSGYHNGSVGRMKVMPVEEGRDIQSENYCCTFSHIDEKAEAGYYRVQFSNDGTVAEVNSSEHTGMFRFTFTPKIKPRIFLGDLRKVVAVGKRMIKGASLNTSAKWMTGQNEEFPGQRIFNGIIDHFKIFVEPLNCSEIKKEMLNGHPETE